MVLKLLWTTMHVVMRRALVWSAAGAAGLIGAVLTIGRLTQGVEAPPLLNIAARAKAHAWRPAA
jgi:3-oxoacyl-(acyl-carrier-protein) synthase